jgi:NAD(P)H-hydrate epimerase
MSGSSNDRPRRLLLTRAQVREIDRLAIEQYGIPGIVLMENASRAAARIAIRMLRRRPRRVLILCGGGNNGGDGLAIARHVHNHLIEVTVAATVAPDSWQGDAAINASILQAMGVPVEPATPAMVAAWQGGLIVDAIFGTGLARPPRPPFPELARAVNGTGIRVLAVDVPSGLDCDTGLPLGEPEAVIRANVTVTFVARKPGFVRPQARPYLGHVVVVDIGVPRELIERVRGGAAGDGRAG